MGSKSSTSSSQSDSPAIDYPLIRQAPLDAHGYVQSFQASVIDGHVPEIIQFFRDYGFVVFDGVLDDASVERSVDER